MEIIYNLYQFFINLALRLKTILFAETWTSLTIIAYILIFSKNKNIVSIKLL